jgi:hypothetical protein
MADERLTAYIRECLRKGYPSDYILRTLANEGWKIDHVKEAIESLQAPSKPPPAPPSMLLPSKPQAPQTQPTQQARPTPSRQPPPKPAPSKPPTRPTGITVICILGFLGAGFSIFSGIIVISLSTLFSTFVGTVGGETAAAGELFTLGSLIALSLIIIGVIEFVAFFLLLGMKRTGFILVVIMEIITIALAATSINILTIAIAAVILVYLLMKRNLFI